MDKFMQILESIDWIFAGVILLGGRYWGVKYFKLSKKPALNFLGFATAFGIAWLVIKYYTVGISKSEIANLFITYLFTTSFYETIGQTILEKIESWLPFMKKEKTATVITVDTKGEVTNIEETKEKPENGTKDQTDS